MLFRPDNVARERGEGAFSNIIQACDSGCRVQLYVGFNEKKGSCLVLFMVVTALARVVYGS